MAIAFDAANNGTLNNTNNISWSHTCSGSNRMLFVVCSALSGDEITGVTYNGVAMTQVAKVASWSPSYFYLYALQAPATGTNTVEVTTATSNYKSGCSVSYTGVNQSTTLDNIATHQVNSQASPYQRSLTSVADNCWHLFAVGTNGGALTAQQTFRAGDTSSPYTCVEDNNSPKTPPGSVTLGWTSGSTNNYGSVIASFAPASAGPAGVKTLNGITLANVKTVNGIATGSVKSINGIA